MTNQQSDDNKLTRRDALKGGLLAAGAALLPSGVSDQVMAQSQSARLVLGQDSSGQDIIQIDDETQNDGTHDAVIRHVNNDDELRYDSSEETWKTGSLDTDVLTDVHRKVPADEDYQGIQRVVDEANEGDTLVFEAGAEYLFEGTYSDGPLVSTTKSLRWVIPPTTTLRLVDNTTDSGEGARMITFDTAADDLVVIEGGGTIDGNVQNNGSDPQDDGHNLNIKEGDVIIDGLRSINSTGDGAAISGSSLNFSNLFVSDCYEQNLHIAWCEEASLSNVILGPCQNGGSLDFTSFAGKVAKDISLNGVVIDGGDTETAGVYINSGNGTVRNVSGHVHVKNVNGPGVFIEGDSGTPDNVPDGIDLDVYVHSCGGPGVRVTTCGDVAIGGTSRQNDGHGAYVDPNNGADTVDLSELSIRNNNRDDGFSRGILVETTAEITKLYLPQEIRSTTTPYHDYDIELTDLASSSSVHLTDADLTGSNKNGVITGNYDPDVVRNLDGLTVENYIPSATKTGDGTTKTWFLDHGLDLTYTDTLATVEPANNVTRGIEWYIDDITDSAVKIITDTAISDGTTGEWRVQAQAQP